MTTDGTNGTPEGGAEHDPFAYLYRPAEGEGAPAAQRPSGYSRPMEVGRAQYGAPNPYGQQQPPAQYGQSPQYGEYGQSPQHGHSSQYGATEPTAPVPQQSRYAERSRPRPGEERRSGTSKGAVIGAVAVIAAISVGAGIALSSGDEGKSDTANGGATHAATTPSARSGSPSASASASASAGALPVSDATKLQAQGAAPANTVKGAISSDGSYLTLQAGSTVTWTVTVPTGGQYRWWFRFNNTGADYPAAVTVNGQPRDGGITFKNYSKSNPDPNSSWYYTNIWPQLQAGSNTLTVTVPAGSNGSILLDQVALTTTDQAPWK